MDTINAVGLAERIGVSLPTAHALLDRDGVPRTGRGVERTVPAQVAERIVRERGSGYSPTALRVLAALLASPMGLGSIRSIAAVAGVSPTSVGKLLPSLLDTGLVRHREQREIQGGRVTTSQRFTLDLRSPAWALVAESVRATPLPTRVPERAVRLPQSFWHLFWNGTPAALRIDRDGTYIGRRMLTAGGAAAAQWALEHIDAPDLLAVVRGRGSDARTRAMVENWIAATLVTTGTVKGVLGETKVQFVDASSQHRIGEPKLIAGIRVAGIEDILATKLRVVMDGGALRDYFDLMSIEHHTDLDVIKGLALYLERYQPKTPDQHIGQILRALGFFEDVDDDPSLPVGRGEIERYWKKRQPEVVRGLGLR